MYTIEISGEIHDHMKSGQLCRWGRNRIKTELMMFVDCGMLPIIADWFLCKLPIYQFLPVV